VQRASENIGLFIICFRLSTSDSNSYPNTGMFDLENADVYYTVDYPCIC